jgi:hypothetical protein
MTALAAREAARRSRNENARERRGVADRAASPRSIARRLEQVHGLSDSQAMCEVQCRGIVPIAPREARAGVTSTAIRRVAFGSRRDLEP